MEKIKEMESKREFSIQTERANQLDEDGETYNRIMLGGLEERDVNTEQKVLGTNWNYFTDEFLFKFQTQVGSAQGLMPTKRNVLRVVASFYDPMGLISPIIVQMKILLQDICKANYHWDAKLDSELTTRWMKLISELGQVKVIQIPRFVTSEPDTKEFVYELEAFGDASSSAYAAVVYLVIKSRFDSNNVLYWIKGKDKEWKQFVNHRVAEIRQLLPTDVWAHVPGRDTPADLASRGVNPLSLVSSALWWNEPTWISSQEEVREVEDVSEMIPPPPECVKEMKVQAQRDLEESASLIVTNTPEVGVAHIINCEDYSHFSKLCRVTAYVIRFVNNIKARSSKPVSPVGSRSFTSEVLFSESLWILESQKSLLQNRNFKQQCVQLGVIKDMNGILRCKGRLCNSPLPETAKFPPWLPCDHHITKLIIRDCHHKVMHNGVRETLTELRSRFWLTKGRQVIRKQIYNCVVCRRYEGRSYKVEPDQTCLNSDLRKDIPFQAQEWTLLDRYL
ncbi:PREDICTED: uncharacterized protein LOC107334213 [Acropora digitifera]|uniref:uncharacterized protein LOC107334213 n=1 Tax=Acropora digitifera TaxID=70779 RepID=UPI00077A55C8|nr:PREDICTED: uncharacterized protein LOC107334213 [Acropora digitifera]